MKIGSGTVNLWPCGSGKSEITCWKRPINEGKRPFNDGKIKKGEKSI